MEKIFLSGGRGVGGARPVGLLFFGAPVYGFQVQKSPHSAG